MRQSDRRRIAEQFRSDAALNECTTNTRTTFANMRRDTLPLVTVLQRLDVVTTPEVIIETDADILERFLRESNLNYALEVFAIARIRSPFEN
jgi:hypothetical protein